MQISASRLAEYTAALNAQQQTAFNFMQTALRSFYQLNGGAIDAETMREFAMQTLTTCVQTFGDRAATIACSAYDVTMEELGIDVQPSTVYNPVSIDSTGRQVDYLMRQLTPDAFDSFAQKLAARAYENVGRAANKTTIHNAERDYSKGVRYARVPTGKETCGFCLMLASRGFDYKSRKSAGDMGFGFNRFHDRCDCRVVAGDDFTTVEGYDPDWLYDVYLDARSTIDPASIRREMAGLPAQIVNKKITDEICKEINRRSLDWSWNGGKVESGTGEYKRFTAALAEHGYTTSITDREDAPLRMSGLTWGMADATGGDVSSSISTMRQERKDGGTDTAGHYVLLVDGINGAVQSVRNSLQDGETAILIDTKSKGASGLSEMRRITR
ncbi:VG15 protein [Collinsella sp. CM84Y_54]|uniref:VG15 protein n=1 Tax=Collinsella sp. CM84Y_54 TaxID=3085309 RepID=UPI002E77D79E|nr:hypothetical protein [Collinsella sp. CM84Y_54]